MLYFRDLKENVQEQLINLWKEEKRTELLEAIEKGEDVSVGIIFDDVKEHEIC